MINRAYYGKVTNLKKEKERKIETQNKRKKKSFLGNW